MRARNHQGISRRQFAQLAGLGGVAFASGVFGLGSTAGRALAAAGDFMFVQLSDSHWGFSGDAVNPEAKTTLKRAVAAVNSLPMEPDFVVFTGDLTHTTDDAQERRRRMGEFRDIVHGLKVKTLHFMPGEHDASLDNGAAFKEFFGDTHYSFDHKGVHFIVLDNVSDPAAKIGEEQLGWLNQDLAKLDKAQPIVAFTHRPLFDLYPDWDWTTRDGKAVIDALMPYQHVTVFYGHIHQEHHHMTGHIAHNAAKSLIFPLPVAGSQPKRTPIPWDAAQPFKGLGWRSVEAEVKEADYKVQEHPADKV
ncbi:MAG TPA: metallophosphoesterase [Stellaceae bacterium]|nr:metallophosphoesterase [Stellaceae bacterium]